MPYDLSVDPYAVHSVNEEHPELVDKYTKLLLAQWEAHQALTVLFAASGETEMTPEQLRTLQSQNSFKTARKSSARV